ncbi:MAG: glycoside hydrolase family 3 protein [Oscillospiraceae bacterium]|nr:glycoside hydrolase family 3 protein [Oscillospiraceae bacterium]
MAKAKSKKKKKKQTRELMILVILILISAGLIVAMFTLYAQRKKQAGQSAEVNIPQRPEETGVNPVVIPDAQPVPETEPVTEASDPNLLLAEEAMQNMTLEDKIYQMFIVTPEVLVDREDIHAVVQTGDLTKAAIDESPVGGIVYFSQNLEDEEQTKDMISGAQDYMKEVHHVGMWIAVDEEGGTVARVSDSLDTRFFDDMAVYGEEGDTEAVRTMGTQIAEDISQFGFNLDFAPVADVNINPDNELQDRIFSDDPAVVSDMVAAMVQGLQSSGQVSATLKHFPGLGAEDGNTHEDDTTLIDRTYEDLDAVDFVPFRSGIAAGAEFVMVGHQVMSCAGDDMPSDLSHVVVTDWLRNGLGYSGIIITDAHNMNTITANYSSGEAALLAFQAGVDVVLMPEDLSDAVETVAAAVESGELSEEQINESVRRILTAKAKHHLL